MELLLDMPLEEQAATAAFCPVSGSTQLLAVGTYELDEATGQRIGSTVLLSVKSGASTGCTVDPVASLPSAGVFELAWSCHGSSVVLGRALADGCVSLLDHEGQAEPGLTSGTSARAFDGGALCTNLSFSPAGSADQVAVSSSAGDVAVLSQVGLG